MDDIRTSFSRMKKKIKQRLTGSKRKPDRTETDTPGERADSPGSLPRPETRVLTGGGHDQGEKGANTDGQQAYSTDRGRREVDIGGGAISQKHSYLRSDVGSAVGSKRSGEGERVYSSTSTPQIPSSGKPDGARTSLFWLPPLIVPLDESDNEGTSVVPDNIPEGLRPGDSTEPSAAAKENRPGWVSTASATAKLLLRGVRDSADAFAPLKSVAGGLCFILENCEVRPSLHKHYPQHLQVPQRTTANKEAIESLAPRVKALAELLCKPVSESDVEERERRGKLER